MARSNRDFGKKHLPLSTANVQGHLHKHWQNLQSTKSTTMEFGPDEKATNENDIFPTVTQPHTKCNQVAYVLINQDKLRAAYQDLTGRFPVKSLRGNEYASSDITTMQIAS